MGWPWGPPKPPTGLARVLSAGPAKVCQDLRGTGLSATLSLRGDLEGSGGGWGASKRKSKQRGGGGDLGKRRRTFL